MVKKVFTAMLLALALIINSVLPTLAETASGTSLRLEKTEGTVTVTNKNGKEITTSDGMILYNGYTITTGISSFAYISLDSSKAIKLDAVSSVEVKKNGNKLEVLLKSGDLFFDVSSPVSEDSSLNIRTSTMVTGIRGTMGVVSIVDQFNSILYMLEGTVEVSVVDPETEVYSDYSLTVGQTLTTTLLEDETRIDQEIDVKITELKEAEVPPFVGVEFAAREELRNRLDSSIIDVKELTKDAAARLAAEQKELKKQQEAIEDSLKSEKRVTGGTENVIPVFDSSKTNLSQDSEESTPSAPSLISYGGTTYSSWAAFEAVYAGDGFTVLADVTGDFLEITSGTLTVNSGVTLTITDGITVGDGASPATVIIQNEGSINLGLNIDIQASASLTVNGDGTISTTSTTLPLFATEQSSLTINGGTYESSADGYTLALLDQSNMDMSGGSISVTGVNSIGVYISNGGSNFTFASGTISAGASARCCILQNITDGATYTNTGGTLNPTPPAQGMITE
ncbi:MAG: FecR domain-containing protein [Lachnospiraceae bacterium]|nr:FecR domain-containing protein [Lachnospiraceae bacterium]